MKKKVVIITVSILCFFGIVLIVAPMIKIDRNNQIKYISYTDIIDDYDEVTCYDDGLSYYEEKNITITKLDIEKVLFFYIVTLEYENGNLCDYEYVLEESYIQNFIDNAEIKYNEKNIDVAKLIKDKEAIVSNTRYLGNDYESSISYILDGKYEILYVFNVDDLLVIQVGYPDEGPKFIAYK